MTVQRTICATNAEPRMLPDPSPMDMDRPSPLSVKRRRWLWRSVLAVAATAGAYGIWWQMAATGFERGIADWTAERRADGWRIGYRKLEIGGFPFYLRAAVERPAVAGPPERGWAWQGDRLFASVRPWSPHRIRFDLAGKHSGRLPLRTRVQDLELQAAVLEGEMHIRQGRPRSVDIAAEGFVLLLDGGASGSIDIAEGEARLAPEADDATEFQIRLRDLVVAEALRAPLGGRLRNLLAKGRVTGPIEPAAWPDSVVHWREAGGTVEVETLDVDYEPLRLTGDGTLALDKAMQPMGAFSARARGVFAAGDELVTRGFMDKRDALAAKLVLGVLAKKPEAGGETYLELAVTVQDRTLYAGPVKVMRLPIIIW